MCRAEILLAGLGPGLKSQDSRDRDCRTVLLLKSRGTTNPDISGQESQSVPGRSRCPVILPTHLGKIMLEAFQQRQCSKVCRVLHKKSRDFRIFTLLLLKCSLVS